MAAIKEEITPEIVTPHFMDTDAEGDLKPEIKLEIEDDKCEEPQLFDAASSVNENSEDASDLDGENSKEQTHYCPFCEFQSTTKTAVAKHKRSVHVTNGQFICPVCAKPSRDSTALESHLIKIHRKEVNTGQFRLARKIHRCSHCDFQTDVFVQFGSHNMRKHGIAVDDLPKFECDQCDYVIYERCKFKTHQQTHGKKCKPFECSFCEKGFYVKRFLDFHILTYHTVTKIEVDPEKITVEEEHSKRRKRSRRIVKCALCKFTANANIKVMRHIKRDHKNFVCETCDITFTTVMRLDHHILKYHRFEDKFLKRMCHKVHECNTCPYMSLSRTNMHRHCKTHHGK